jgi:hypothetical protein
MGPFRLGTKFQVIPGTIAQFPYFWLHYERVYTWFADEGTVRQSSMAGYTSGYFYPSTTDPGLWEGPFFTPNPPVGMTPVDQGNQIGNLSLAAQVVRSGVGARFTNTTIQGVAVDTTGLNNGLLVGVGSGAIDANKTGSTVRNSVSMAAPFAIDEDLDVTKNGGASTGALVVDSDGQERACPISATRTYHPRSWSTSGNFSAIRSYNVRASWASEQNPAWRSDDLTVALFTQKGIGSPGAVDPYYLVSIKHLAEIDVHRPDGNRPSDWVTQDVTRGIVTELAGVTTFNILQAGAVFRRVFGQQGTDRPVWRRWVGVGTQGKSDAEFHPDRAEWTKHTLAGATNQDVFGWESYAYLRLQLTAPAAGTLTLQVEGVHLAVSDSHVTGSQRNSDFAVSETPFSVQYSVPVAAGTNTVDIDLLLPQTGATSLPFYPGRVDALQLSGFAVGTYTLSSIKLVARGQTYLKCDWGPPVQRDDYSAIGWANGGSWGAGGLPDQLYKPDEVGSSPLGGGNLRFVYIMEGAVTGVITDSQLSLSGFLGQLSNLEGWSVSYDQAAFDAANKDAFGSALSPENAQNLLPLVPYVTLIPGVDYQPPCNWVCRQISIVNGQPFHIRSRWPLGHGGIEAVVVEERERAPAGWSLNLVRTDTGAVAAAGLTDEHGYVVWTPVPAGVQVIVES